MRTGRYDGVSASGDATLRLIAGGDVAPVNTGLVPNYADIYAALKNQYWNSAGGKMYGIPHGRGANILMWNPKIVKQAPTSWSAVFDKNSPYKGKVTAYDSPIYIADAALYLQKPTRAEDHERLRARPEAVRRRGRPAQDPARQHGPVLVGLHEGAAGLRAGRLGRRHELAGHRQPARRRQGQGRHDAAQRGLDGLVGHLDDRGQGPASELHVQVDELDRLAEDQRGGGGVVRRGAVEREGLRLHVGQDHSATRSTPDQAYFDKVRYWTTPRTDVRRLSRGGRARTTRPGCRPGPRSRASRSVRSRTVRRSAGRRLADRCTAAAPAGRCCCPARGLAGRRLPRLARRPVRRGVLAPGRLQRQGRPSYSLENFQTLWNAPVYRTIVLRTVGIAALVTVTDTVLAFPIAFYMAKVARRACAACSSSPC